jgi:hypothetical protein
MYVNGKMIPAGTIPRMREGGDKGEWWWGGDIQVWYT